MGRKQKHPIVLSQMEREALEGIVKGGKNKLCGILPPHRTARPSYKVRRASC